MKNRLSQSKRLLVKVVISNPLKAVVCQENYKANLVVDVDVDCVAEKTSLLIKMDSLRRVKIIKIRSKICKVVWIHPPRVQDTHTHKPKSDDSIKVKLYLLHMDLCGPMRIESINGKNYILVIVDDYSRFTWVKFLRLKDETQEFIIKFLKNVQVRLNARVRNIRTDNGIEFVNHTLKTYYEDVGISHQTSIARTPQQNGVVEIRN
ncbi:putative ribonuclease H-like domain-containing protein [Tanacetum coccineum]